MIKQKITNCNKYLVKNILKIKKLFLSLYITINF